MVVKYEGPFDSDGPEVTSPGTVDSTSSGPVGR